MAEADGLQDITNVDSTPLDAGAPRQLGVAETLRTAREGAGLDIKQLSALTRVTSRHLISLETGDYAALPGRPYALGFAKAYARAVGLDGAVIANAVRAELDEHAPEVPLRVISQFEVGDPAKTPTRLTVWLAAGLVVAILLAGLVFWRSYYFPSVSLPSLIGDEQPVASTSQVAVVPLPPVSPNGPVIFTATAERIWVKFYDVQGQQLLQKELTMGEAFTIPSGAQEPMLRTARPDALSITVGGQPVPRIAETEGLVKDVPVSAAALLARGNLAPLPTAITAQTPAVLAGPAAVAAPSAIAPRPRRVVPRRSAATPATSPETNPETNPATNPVANTATTPAAQVAPAGNPPASTGI